MDFTKEQEQVITLRDRNLLVSAAAGSGKTTVLVERICRMILDEKDPMDVDELLVVTFTEAAASEMKNRLLNALMKRSEEEPRNIHLKRQLSLIHQAMITTIDGFCMQFLKEHFYLTELEPGFRVVDNNEQKLIMEDVMEHVLQRFYEEKDPKFLAFVDNYASGRSDEKLVELIKKFYESAISTPWPKLWITRCKQAYEKKDAKQFYSLPILQEIVQDTQLKVKDAMALLSKASDSIAQSAALEKFYLYLLDEKERLAACMNAESVQDFYPILTGYKMGRMPTIRNLDEADGEAKDYAKSMRDGAAKILKELAGDYYFRSPEEMMEDYYGMKDMAGVLCDLTLCFYEEFTKEKRKRDVVDFSDMEHLTLEILYEEPGKVSSVGKSYGRRFKEIMMDEYQDSNALQEAIVSAIQYGRGKKNRFMVGDVKQSIYRFRQAEPELFVEKYDTYRYGDGEEVKIDLDQNFRSRSQVLTFSNQIFEALMQRNLGDIAYDEHASLKYGANYNRDLDELYIPEVVLFDRGMEEEDNQDKEKAEAILIGEKIREFMEKGQVTEKDGSFRKPCYKDIVILLRSKKMAPIIAEELKKMSIPAVAMEKTGYFETPEVNCVLSFLQLVDNVRQDIPLFCVLNSPIVGLKDSELADIKAAGSGKHFYEDVLSYTRKPEIEEKLQDFFRLLEEFRRLAVYRPIHELILLFYEKTGYEKYVGLLPGGNVKQMNLNILVERARAYESSSYHGLFHFLRYIHKLKEYNLELTEGSPDAGKDAVFLMTIHKSKGLEFPMVIVAGLGRGFNKSDAKADLLIGVKEGILLRYIDGKKRIKRDTVFFKAMKNKIVKDNLAEEIRVLYVALTRAKEKLVITGSVKDYEAMKAGAEFLLEGDRVSYSAKLKAKNFLDFILPALFGRKIYTQAMVDISVHGAVLENVESALQLMEKEEAAELFLHPMETKEGQQELRKMFASTYFREAELSLPIKMSVSEIKHHFMDALYEAEEVPEFLVEPATEEESKHHVPAFLAEEGSGETSVNPGALRGTAVHRALECIAFEDHRLEEPTEETIRAELMGIEEAGLMSKEAVELVNVRKLLTFFKSPLGQQMRKAAKEKSLTKEQPFVMAITPKEAGLTVETEDKILVQGIIDAFYEKEGKLVLVDYKTDRVESGKELSDRYRKQMELYKDAIERIFQKPVKSIFLYSFHLQEAIDVLAE
ncbi:MAG: helicase-exonuclease AddAB subunit AddA [Lachnospiraceae bacterium]|nr:helicase-exonuclease AddAB subunit AddA [Lachnospiraceae bacterium]